MTNRNLSGAQFDPETPKRFADLINAAGADEIKESERLDRFHDLNRELEGVDPDAHRALRQGIRRWGSMGGASSLDEDDLPARILRETVASAGTINVPQVHRGQLEDHEGLSSGVTSFESRPRSYSRSPRVAEKFARAPGRTGIFHHVEGPVRGLDLRALQNGEEEVIMGGQFEVNRVQRDEGRLDAFMRQRMPR